MHADSIPSESVPAVADYLGNFGVEGVCEADVADNSLFEEGEWSNTCGLKC